MCPWRFFCEPAFLILQNLLVSHPVSAKKTGNASHFSVSNVRAMRVVLRYRNVSPVSNDAMSCRHVSLLVVLTVPTVLTRILLHPCLAPSAACSSIRVSTSSWVQGDSFCSLITSEKRSSFPRIITTTPRNVSVVTFSLTRLNSFCLVSVFWQKLVPVPGSFLRMAFCLVRTPSE